MDMSAGDTTRRRTVARVFIERPAIKSSEDEQKRTKCENAHLHMTLHVEMTL
jgi:hypothetical protein